MPSYEVSPAAVIDLSHGKRLGLDRLRPVGPDDTGAEGGPEVALVDESGRLLGQGQLHEADDYIQPTKVFVS